MWGLHRCLPARAKVSLGGWVRGQEDGVPGRVLGDSQRADVRVGWCSVVICSGVMYVGVNVCEVITVHVALVVPTVA
jgi:hypothetical protein